MRNTTIYEIDFYLDGGSAKIETSRGTFFVDRSIKTETPGTLWSDEGKLISMKAFKPDILNALKHTDPNQLMFCDENTIKKLIDDISASSD